jgi:hypothetical protein
VKKTKDSDVMLSDKEKMELEVDKILKEFEEQQKLEDLKNNKG